MRRIVLLALVAAITLTAPARAADSFAAVYTVVGANPNGKPYHGHCEILAQEAGYLLHWVLEQGEEAWGMGFVSDGRLIVAAGAPTVAGVLLTNVAVYAKKKDTLAGEWTTPQSKGIYKETLTRTAGAMPEPSHPVLPQHEIRERVSLH